MKRMLRILALLSLASGLSATASAQLVKLTIKNLSPSSPTGLYLAPVWLGFHDGGFDSFDAGTTANTSIETIAELGNSSLLNTAFLAAEPSGMSTVLNHPAGPGPGIFVPGASNSVILDLHSGDHRYLSFAAMIVPSNDSFVANDNPTALALFDASGMFLGRQTWTFTGANVWDAGSEVNAPLEGAAFVDGIDAMLGSVEGGLIHGQPLDGLDNVIGLNTPAGTTIGRGLTDDRLLSITITPVPEPSTYGIAAALGLLAVAVWKRRRAAGCNQPGELEQCKTIV